MPSRKSKSSPSRPSPWKEAPTCSEAEIESLARALARELSPGDRVLLEGPMGAGKTTFARALLSALGVTQPPEGSPSFAIAHEYDSPKGRVAHMDLYRIRSEDEIEEAGLHAYFWEGNRIVIAEWLSSWPEFEAAIARGGGRIWRVDLGFAGSAELRSVKVTPPA